MSTEQAKTATETQTAGPRVITVVSTRGEKVKIPFEGNTWTALKEVLTKGGKDVEGNSFSPFSLSNMKCVESINKTTLEHAQAVVPDGNFNLFMMPLKSKSGADMKRGEINEAIKAHIAADGQKAKDFFSVDGKNYTQVPSATLVSLLEKYKPGAVNKAKAARAEATANVADVVQSVAKAKTAESAATLEDELNGLSHGEKLDLVIKLLLDMRAGGGVIPAATAEVAQVPEAPKAPATPVESPEDKAKREAKEQADREEAERKAAKEKAEKEEAARLDKEMQDMMGGFNDVAR